MRLNVVLHNQGSAVKINTDAFVLAVNEGISYEDALKRVKDAMAAERKRR